MAKYERIMPMKNIPFVRIIIDYQKEFTGRDIYVSDKTYSSLLDFFGYTHEVGSKFIVNRKTETKIVKSYRVPDYVAYAIKR